MTHSHEVSAPPSERSLRAPEGKQRPGVRAAGKARSRKRLLEAAKRLFMEHGYEGATVREIAAAAGLSTGAVFASFSDKADLFGAVLAADGADQLQAMKAAAAEPGTAGQRLLEVMRVAYGFHLKQLQLVRAGLSVSWSQGLQGPLGDRPVRQEVTGMLTEIVEGAVAGGELKPVGDPRLIVEMLWDCYVGGYRYAIYSGWNLEQLSARLKAQIELLLAGQGGA